MGTRGNSIMEARGRRARAALAVLAAGAVLVAACGGSSKKTAKVAETTTTTVAGSTETSVTGDTGSTSTTTAAPGTGAAAGTTRTTVKSSTKATSSKVTPPAASAALAGPVRGGITNVTAAPATAPSANIQAGGSLTYYKGSDIASLDPVMMQNSGSTDAPPGSMVYDLLVYADLNTGQVMPQTAESLTSTDALVWTLKLHPNIKFTDGTPYDAAAVKFNWQRLQDPKNGAFRAAQANLMQSMDVVDATTLRITLKTKNAVFPQAVTLMPFIASPAAVQAQGSSYGSNPVGAGPFILKSWTRDSEQVLVRNPNYWNAPRPFLDQVNVKVVADSGQRLNTFRTAPTPGLVFINTIQDAQQAIKQGGSTTNVATLNGGVVIFFNLRKAPFNDIRLRQAIGMAVDRADLMKTIEGDQTPPVDSVFRHQSPFYDPSITQIGYDPTKAQQLFDQLASERGGPVEIPLQTFNVNIYPLVGQYIQGALSKFKNVKVTLDTVSPATLVTASTKGDFSIVLYGNIFIDPDPLWFGMFTCSAQAQFTGFCNQQFDADVADQSVALDPAKRVASVRDAQRVFYSQLPAVYEYGLTSWVFSTPSVQDFQFANDGLELFDRMWIKSR